MARAFAAGVCIPDIQSERAIVTQQPPNAHRIVLRAEDFQQVRNIAIERRLKTQTAPPRSTARAMRSRLDSLDSAGTGILISAIQG